MTSEIRMYAREESSPIGPLLKIERFCVFKQMVFLIASIRALIETTDGYSRPPHALARILTSLQVKKAFLLRFRCLITHFTSFAASCKRQNYVHTF